MSAQEARSPLVTTGVSKVCKRCDVADGTLDSPPVLKGLSKLPWLHKGRRNSQATNIHQHNTRPHPAVKWAMDSTQKTADGASQAAAVKNPSANSADARDAGSIPGPGRSSGEGNDNPLQNSRLGNPMDRGAWWATVHGVTKSWTGLSMHTHGT